jgi:hypothetical protein
MKVNIYIGFWTLEMKCTQYGICGEVAFKNARAKVFLEIGRGKSFRASLENHGFFVRQLPMPISTSLERLVGGRISSSILRHVIDLI